ncbi:hypothetical protein FQR65_LT01983 [Abscondita terminalis]|nr:hypothetical protein FQR65_LT01983 [Abscondita terminalis]
MKEIIYETGEKHVEINDPRKEQATGIRKLKASSDTKKKHYRTHLQQAKFHFQEPCPPDSGQLEGECKCDHTLCDKPPCATTLVQLTNLTDTPGSCCPTYSCEGCEKDDEIDGLCPCLPGAILRFGRKCECANSYDTFINGTCECDIDKCPLPDLCDKGSVGVKEFDGCCERVKCIVCPEDSYSTLNNDPSVEDKCVCFPCPPTTCRENQSLRILRKGKNVPGTCCDFYSCNNGCTVNGTMYEDGESWSSGDGKCKCQNGISHCSPIDRNKLFKPCLSGDKVYHHLESWIEDSCTNCTCENGNSKCIAHMCDIHISEVKSPITVECPSLSTCKKVCEHGFRLNKQGCEICKCKIEKVIQNKSSKLDMLLVEYNLTEDDVVNMVKDYLDFEKSKTSEAVSSSTTTTTTTTTSTTLAPSTTVCITQNKSVREQHSQDKYNSMDFILETTMSEQSSIQNFYAGKTIFMTGGTGYVGSALIEKLLRSCPDVKKIYTMVRDKKDGGLEKRYKEWCTSKVFTIINQNNPDSLKKVVFLKGELQAENLGLSDEDVELLVNEVNCVFHAAAEVKFVGALTHLLKNNLVGTNEILELAKKIKHLQTFVYVSTCYSQCNKFTVEETMYESFFDSEKMLMLLKTMDSSKIDEMAPQVWNGFPNNYTFSKFLAEDLVRRRVGNLPVAVVRPTIIAPSLREPMPGWTNKYQSYPRTIISFASGLLHVLPSTPEDVIDIVPLDHTVNLVLAAAWELGRSPTNKTIQVYNCGTSDQSPLPYGKSETLLDRYDAVIPSTKKIWHRFVIISHSVVLKNFLFAFLIPIMYIVDLIQILGGKRPTYVTLYKRVHALMKVSEPFSSNTWLFKTDNTKKLWKKLDKDDKDLFDFDLGAIDWDSAVYVFISGVRLYILDEEPDTIPSALFRRRMLMILHYFTVGIYTTILQSCVQKIVKKVFDEDDTLLYVHLGDTDVFPWSATNPQAVLDAKIPSLPVPGYKHFKHNYVLHAKSWEMVQNTLVRIRGSALWHKPSSYYGTYLIITQTKTLQNIFQFFWSVGIVNVIVLMYDGFANAWVFTSNPQSRQNQCGLKLQSFLTKTDCLSTDPVTLPKTLRKFSNCSLNYVSVTGKARTGIKQVEAAWLVLDTMVSHFEVTKVFLIDPSNTKPVYDMFTFMALFKVYLKNEISTSSYFTEDFVWIVLKPRPIPILESVALAFKKIVWVMILVVFLSATMAWWLIARYYFKCPLDFSKVLLRVFSITLFGNVHKYETLWSIRYIFIVYVIYSIHIQTAFVSKLIEILTVPHFEPPIKTIQELADSDVSILIREDFYNAYFNAVEPEETLYSSVKRKVKAVEVRTLTDLFFENNTYYKYALIVPQSQVEIILTLMQFHLNTISDNKLMMKFSNVFMGSSNAYVLKTIDNVISILMESGIHDYFIKNVKVPKRTKEKDISKKVVLKLKHLYFVFVFWSIGLIFGFLVFIGEMFWHFWVQ